MYATFIPGLGPLAVAWDVLRTRLAVEKDEAGYTTETIVITALLVLMAIGAITLIATSVHNTASSIKTDPAPGFGS